VTADEYYVNPLNHIVRLYEKYLAQMD
jgi:hypothetical protein